MKGRETDCRKITERSTLAWFFLKSRLTLVTFIFRESHKYRMYVQRSIAAEFDKRTGAYGMVAVVGPRQAGKTTFLKHAAAGRDASYVLLDDPDARELFETDVKKFEKQYFETRELAILDEVQNCRNAGRNLKYLADSGRKAWLTSSSEVLLGKKVLSYLVGRVSILRLYPFSLGEFLQATRAGELTEMSARRGVWEHATYGGYPKVVTTNDIELKKTMLFDLYQTMLLKDVAWTFSVEDTSSLERLAKYVAVNAGGIFSYEHASRDLSLSFQTVKKYLDAMEKSYLVGRAPPFYTNKKKEITKQAKFYFIDGGLRNAILHAFPTEPDGNAFENYIYTELAKAGYAPQYWRTKGGAEVDFVIQHEGKPVPVEAKLRADSVERSMHSFISAYGPSKALVVTYHGKGRTEIIDGCRVSFTTPAKLTETLGKP